jgi:hypothetical protein
MGVVMANLTCLVQEEERMLAQAVAACICTGR